MPSFKFAVFCLLFLPFLVAKNKEREKEQQKEPVIHQIRFGNIVGVYPGNKENQGYKFHYFLIIDLSTDSILLKKNQFEPLAYEQENLPAKYYSGKIPPELKKELANFKEYVLKKKNGAKYKLNDLEPTVFYSGPVTFLEYKKDTAIRYFFQKHIKSAAFYDPQLGTISEKLFELAVNHQGLKLSDKDYKLNDDSLIAPIANRPELSAVAFPPPPPIQKTIKFTPPVERKNK